MLALVPAAGAAAATSTLTRADTALARAALLVRADVGQGWSSAPAPAKVPPLTCTGFEPNLNGVVETGAAASRTFSESSSDLSVSSVAYVYKTAAQTTEVWHRAVTRRLLTCFADSLVSGSAHGVKFTVDRKHMLSLPPIGGGARGYRVVGTASGTDQQVGVYLDAIVLERGRMLAVVTYADALVPAPRSLELRLARRNARRLVN